MKKPQHKPAPLSSFDRLSLRIQKIISSPSAQKLKSAIISKSQDECPEDWSRLLDDISETENVTMTRENDGAVRVTWSLPANI